jgi:hypothetical protein
MNRSNHTGTCQERVEVCQSKQEATGLMKIKQEKYQASPKGDEEKNRTSLRSDVGSKCDIKNVLRKGR